MKPSIHKGLTLISLLLVSALSQAAVVTGKVVGVSDGDTITILDRGMNQHKIRLSGIDAPEKSQPFGQASKKSLSDLVFSQSVDVEYEQEDRYQRKLGKVILSGHDINLEQVRRGYAWHYKAYMKSQSVSDRINYSNAEDAAYQAKAGLWTDKNPVPPWEFRKNARNAR
jgi:endonuclease YncB( thermonuclease family)